MKPSMSQEKIVRGMVVTAAAVVMLLVLIPLYVVRPIQIYEVHVETAAPAASAVQKSPGSGSTSEIAAGEELPVLAEKSIDLNAASLEDLEKLPGIGPVLAERILTFREESKGFGEIEELQDVEGIGEKTFAKLEPYVFVK